MSVTRGREREGEKEEREGVCERESSGGQKESCLLSDLVTSNTKPFLEPSLEYPALLLSIQTPDTQHIHTYTEYGGAVKVLNYGEEFVVGDDVTFAIIEVEGQSWFIYPPLPWEQKILPFPFLSSPLLLGI